MCGTLVSIEGGANCATVFAQELFTALLISPVASSGAVQVNKNEDDHMCDITVGDVLGPLKQEDGERDDNFSLLSYSFSLVSSHLERP